MRVKGNLKPERSVEASGITEDEFWRVSDPEKA